MYVHTKTIDTCTATDFGILHRLAGELAVYLPAWIKKIGHRKGEREREKKLKHAFETAAQMEKKSKRENGEREPLHQTALYHDTSCCYC